MADSAVWPNLHTRDSALVAARQGMWAAVITGCTTAVFSIAGLAGLNAWSLIDAVLWLPLGYGVAKESRVAALLGFGYFVFAKISMMAETGRAGLLAPVVLLLFVNGVRGTFALARLRRQVAPEDGMRSGPGGPGAG